MPHILPRILPWALTLLCITLGCLAASAGQIEELKSLDLEVPSSAQLFSGPDAGAINNNCLACHSADHVLNQPSLPRKTWEEIVNKMIGAYKALISSKDATAIIDYLSRTKGTS
jgi:cytochrome c553